MNAPRPTLITDPDGLEAGDRQPTLYEREQLRELARWREPRDPTLGDSVRRTVDDAISEVLDKTLTVPVAHQLLDRTVRPTLFRLEELALDGFRPLSVYLRFPTPVGTLEEIRERGLRQIDTVIDATRSHYQRYSIAQGASTGVMGAWGLPADFVTLFLLGVRSTAAIATCCGFDVQTPAERRDLLEVMARPVRPWEPRAVPAALPPAKVTTRTTLSVGRNFVRKEASLLAASGLSDAWVRSVVRGIASRMARSRASRLIPVTGAVIGASVNTRFLRGLMEEASNHYRQRYLVQRYGFDAVATAEPAEETHA